jgi:hypothetical protein
VIASSGVFDFQPRLVCARLVSAKGRATHPKEDYGLVNSRSHFSGALAQPKNPYLLEFVLLVKGAETKPKSQGELVSLTMR